MKYGNVRVSDPFKQHKNLRLRYIDITYGISELGFIESNTASPDLHGVKVSIGDIFISGPRKSLTLRKIDPVNRKYSRQEFINIGGRGFWILGAPLKYQRDLYQWKLYFIDSLETLRHLLNGSHWFNNPILDEKVDIPTYLRTRIKFGKTPSYKYEHECQQWLNMSTKSCLAFLCFDVIFYLFYIMYLQMTCTVRKTVLVSLQWCITRYLVVCSTQPGK